MKRIPTRRQEIYDIFWRFAYERQRTFERRVAGEPPPWTEDPLIGAFKFCNVFRAADRVSQYLIRNVAYDDEPCSVHDRLFQIVAFRIFSRIETWQAVRAFLGRQPILEDLRAGRFTEALEYAKHLNGRLYTGAFILCAAAPYGHAVKYLNHVDLFKHMFLREGVGGRLLTCGSLRELYEALHEYPLLGDFMSYQLAIDLNYSRYFNFSENEFTQPGPGALRGIKKVFQDCGSYKPAEIIGFVVEHQEDEFTSRGLRFCGLWGRRLHAIDCQGLFCETDKYCRLAVPALKSARKRIKARFRASPEPMTLFFPPKWGINDQLPKTPVLGHGEF